MKVSNHIIALSADGKKHPFHLCLIHWYNGSCFDLKISPLACFFFFSPFLLVCLKLSLTYAHLKNYLGDPRRVKYHRWRQEL